jgi:hypothetical protein
MKTCLWQVIRKYQLFLNMYSNQSSLRYCWWECKMYNHLEKTLWLFFNKGKHTPIKWPSNSVTRYLSKRNETHAHKRLVHKCL